MQDHHAARGRESCAREADFDRWLDLDNGERDALRDHARQCPGCARALTAVTEVEALLAGGRERYLDLRYDGPRPRWERRARRSGRSWRGWIWRPWPALAAAALVLVAALAIERPWQVEIVETPPPAVEAAVQGPPPLTFSKPPGTPLTLTAASRAMQAEARKRPLSPLPRPPQLHLGFPKRPTASPEPSERPEKAG